MVQRNWTDSQKDAINASGGTILVSAAAGSGKTAVLVQRVIEKITNTINPIDVDRLLIVTFTNAAASEMKERISQRLSELLEENPNNVRLQRQKILLNNANISTIHSFCNNIIRENFYKLSISPDFRIADSNEMSILREEAIQNVMGKFYDEGKRAFFSLVEAFSSDKNDLTLEKAVETLYDFLRSHPFPDKWLDEKMNMYNTEDISSTVWAETLFRYAKNAVDYCISLTNSSLELISSEEKLNKSYQDTFLSDLSMFTSIRESIQNKDWQGVHFKSDSFKFERLSTPKGYSDHEIKIKVSENRKVAKDIKEKIKKYFCASEQEAIEDIKKLKPLVEVFFDVVWEFWNELDRLKLQKNILDFSDLEHFTLKLLVEKTDYGFKRTEDAKAISEKFDEVLVDEYQDTNKAQDIIFRAVSRDEKNLFVVGDVKQSIYGFRQAMPEIFLKRKEEYNSYSGDKKEFPAKIILDKNFRSRRGITESVNFIFSQIMSEEVGDMYYTDEEELKAGAIYPERDSPETEVHVIDISESEDDTDIVEARHIASIISEKIFSGEKVFENGKLRPITYKDFCILIRSANKHAVNYVKELQLCGIPAWSDTEGEFFGTIEISTVVSLLRIIDNPIQDIPLLSVLISPIYGFTAEKLSDIRLADKDSPLYLSLKHLAMNGDDECKKFIGDIDSYRRISATMSAYELISYIYDKTGFTSIVLAMDDRERRLANLRMLSDYAKTYEGYGYTGVSGFIKFIDKLELKKSDLTPASTISEVSNVVKVMSIHRSKGLEFPVCILAGCSNKFNRQKSSVLLHHDLGLGLMVKDKNSMYKYSSIPRYAASVEIDRENMSEELRVLYVALTRAKENLIMITSLKNPQKTLSKLSFDLTEDTLISEYCVSNAANFSELILYCALRHPDAYELRSISGAIGIPVLDTNSRWKISVLAPQKIQEDDDYTEIKEDKCDMDLLEKISNRINYEYSLQMLHNIPTKVSASEIYKEDNLEKLHRLGNGKVPSFILGKDINAADKGIALHLFLEFADYKEAYDDLLGQIKKLVDKKFISENQAKYLDIASLKKFFKSNLMKRILSAQSYKREMRFSVEYDENIIESDAVGDTFGELVVLQGAIDCVFIEDGKAYIIDYKSNALEQEKEYINNYLNQLKIYKYAVEKCLGLEVGGCIIYSFKMGEELSLI